MKHQHTRAYVGKTKCFYFIQIIYMTLNKTEKLLIFFVTTLVPTSNLMIIIYY